MPGDASGSRTKSYQFVVTASMWRCKEDKTSPEKCINSCPRELNSATYVEFRIAEYLRLLCALTSA